MQFMAGRGMRVAYDCQVTAAVVFAKGFKETYKPVASMDATADRSITRWALSSRRASVSASLGTGAVCPLILPVTVHTVVSGWGCVSAVVLARSPGRRGGFF